MPSMWRLGGHLGSSVSALVDGQLDDETAERAWNHTMVCPPCRRLVEHEGWIKRQLAQIADGPRAEQPSDRFLGSLLDQASLGSATSAWAETDELEARGRTRRRAGIALVGVGSVSAVVLGLSALGATPMGVGGTTRTPATSIGVASSSAPTPAFVAPAASVHGRLRGWTLGTGVEDVTHARTVGDRR